MGGVLPCTRSPGSWHRAGSPHTGVAPPNSTELGAQTSQAVLPLLINFGATGQFQPHGDKAFKDVIL